MRHRGISFLTLCFYLWLSTPVGADTGDLSTIIERFVARQFPHAASHFWIVNNTQWDGDEMVVDVNTIVVERRRTEPVENRFLLLIVAGKLAAAQNIPLDASPECRPEQT